MVGPGAYKLDSPWRSELFNYVRTQQAVRLELPFDRTVRLPMIHVDEVARCIQHVVDGPPTAHPLYNLPAEDWLAGELGDYIQQLNPNIQMIYSTAAPLVWTDPEKMNSDRFQHEFGYQPPPLRTYFERV